MQGASGVILPRHRAVGITPAVTKAAAGAIEHVPVAFVSGIPGALERANARVCGVPDSTRRHRRSTTSPSPTRPSCSCSAPKAQVCRASRVPRCDVVASIPMHGHIASLNVSAAAAVACTEIARVAPKGLPGSRPADASTA